MRGDNPRFYSSIYSRSARKVNLSFRYKPRHENRLLPGSTRGQFRSERPPSECGVTLKKSARLAGRSGEVRRAEVKVARAGQSTTVHAGEVVCLVVTILANEMADKVHGLAT